MAAARPAVASSRPAAPLLLRPALTLLLLLSVAAEASRAYPHGCLGRHPSYYTYDERDDAPWLDEDVEDADELNELSLEGEGRWGERNADFRRLPPRSSRLRRPYERYRLTRRLGAGKFSDVFEAVDVRWEDKSRAGSKKKRRVRETGGEESGNDETTTEAEETEAEYEDDGSNNNNGNNDGSIDPRSLVVLKCLKPVSERKIRRELLVLTHCAALPNLARVIGIVLPDSMDEDDDEEEDDQLNEQSTTSGVHHRKRRRHDYLKRENIGSITDAASIEVVRQRKTAAAAQTKNKAQTQLPALVLEHAGQNAQWFCHPQTPAKNGKIDRLSEYEIKYYLCHLLVALDGLHAAGIMHRDVKPRNTLINRLPQHHHHGSGRGSGSNSIIGNDGHGGSQPPQPLMLVDLGLADFYLPGTPYNVRVASRHYKSPELLIGFTRYDYAIDMWSVGCILAGLLFRKEPFFRGKDNEDQLGKIVSVLGTRDFLGYCRKCDARLTKNTRAAIGRYCSKAAEESSSSSSSDEGSTTSTSLLDTHMGRRTPWTTFVEGDCPVPCPQASDLLDKLLVYDHERRWTAREALNHAFFDDVRERVLGEVRERIAREGLHKEKGH